MKILALDLAKSKSVFCDFDTMTGKVLFGNVLPNEPNCAS